MVSIPVVLKLDNPLSKDAHFEYAISCGLYGLFDQLKCVYGYPILARLIV